MTDESKDSAEATAQEMDASAETVAYFRVRSDGHVGSLTMHEIAAGSDWSDDDWRGMAFTEYAVPIAFDVPVEVDTQVVLTPGAQPAAA